VPGVVATWLRYKAVRLHDGVAITTTDISRIKERERELAHLAEFKVSIIAGSPFATIVTDVAGTITSFNPAAERMLGYQRSDLVNRVSVLVMLDRAELAARALALTSELGTPVAPDIAVLAARPAIGLVEEAEWRLVRRDGSRLDVQLTVSTLTSAHGPAGLIMIAYDVTERKRAAEYISHIAHHDELTGLATRRLLRDRADNAIARARRQHDHVAVLTVDLDNFKRINDVQGHHVGDQVLQAVSTRLRSAVRASDSVARVGGDEFVVLVTDLASPAEAEAIAAKLAQALAAPMALDSAIPAPTASIGVAVYPDDGTSVDQLLRSADAAMYQAKADGKHGHQRFTAALASIAVRRRQLDAGLEQALPGDELALVYQPQISMRTGMVTGVEALMRWRSAALGLVMPTEFIAIAEESGLIVPFGEWALRAACRDGQRLQRELGRPLTIAVNLSSRQLFQADLPAIIARILAESGLELGTLELEITESTLIGDGSRSVRALEEIRALGVRLSLDDFGTGFSSLSYIRRFHVDRLKIDRTFIRTIAVEQESRAIVGAIVSLAAGLQIAVIAEGVETAAQRDILVAEGCDGAQGFLFARPVAAGRVGALIRRLERQRGMPAVDRRRGAA
jgi:diguanylate cyclase (GGDEF)-like protein